MRGEDDGKPTLKSCVEEARGYSGGGATFIRVTIPADAELDDAERALVDDGADWPVRIKLVEVPEDHRRFVDFLVDRALESREAK